MQVAADALSDLIDTLAGQRDFSRALDKMGMALPSKAVTGSWSGFPQGFTRSLAWRICLS
jgi:hypothetical protein